MVVRRHLREAKQPLRVCRRIQSPNDIVYPGGNEHPSVQFGASDHLTAFIVSDFTPVHGQLL